MPTAAGTVYWVAAYSGDANNAAVSSGAAAEPVNIDSIATSQTPTLAYVGESISDTATVTGNSPTGTVIFTLYGNASGTGTPLYTSPAETLVGGVATSPGYVPTATGTVYWVAAYGGDANNAAVSSGTAAEPVNIDSIATSQTPKLAYVGESISDTATVTGNSPTGTVIFTLYGNASGTGTPLYTSPAETLVGGVAASPGYVPTAAGTVYWVAAYGGDANNAAVSSGTAAEPVNIDSIATSQTPKLAYVGESISDTATVTGNSPTGTVIFTLYGNASGTGTPLYTSPAETLVGGVATSPAYVPTATGTVYWVAAYGGDANNAAISSGPAAEPVNIDSISTSQTPKLAYVGQSISDTATVTGNSPTRHGDLHPVRQRQRHGHAAVYQSRGDPGRRRGDLARLRAHGRGHGLLGGGLRRRHEQRRGQQRHGCRAGEHRSVEDCHRHGQEPHDAAIRRGHQPEHGDRGDAVRTLCRQLPGRDPYCNWRSLQQWDRRYRNRTGTGRAAIIKVYSQTGTLLTQFQAYPSSVNGGLQVAVADVDGDGLSDIITVPSYGPAECACSEIWESSTACRRSTQPSPTGIFWLLLRRSSAARWWLRPTWEAR